MFKLIREGDGTTGPMGVKAVTNWLNERGYRTRKGAKWGIGPLHKLITSTTYKGEHRFNTEVWKTKEAKPESERVAVPVDPIIDPATFDAVQAQLKSRNPKVTPPRVVTGPILLTGIATCASCGGGMTLRTGKSGRYRYYTCASAMQKGKSAYKGRSIPMDKLDDIATDALTHQLLTENRVEALLTGLLQRQTARDEDHAQRMRALKDKMADAEARLKRLYQAIENRHRRPGRRHAQRANRGCEDGARHRQDRACPRGGGAKPGCPDHGRENHRRRWDHALEPARRRCRIPPGLSAGHDRQCGSGRHGSPHLRPQDRPRTPCHGRRGSSGRSSQFCS